MITKIKKLGDPLPKHIVILRALQLGDLLCAVPAFRALKSALPHSSITLIGLPWASEFVKRFHHYIDHFIEFPGFPGFPEITPQIERLPPFLSHVQTLGFDLALQMQGSGWLSNSLTMLFGALFNAGFYVPGQYCPDENRFLAYPDQVSEVKRHLKLMEFLGIPSQGENLEFPLTEQDWKEYQHLEEAHGLDAGNFICVHPGSRAVERRWPTERFAAVADGMAERGFQVVLTGREKEKHLTTAVAKQMRFPVIDLAGKTSLGGIGALICKSRMMICNDTGVSHLADALQVPSLVLFSASDSLRWAPADRAIHRIFETAQNVQPHKLLEEADKLLRRTPAYAN